MNHPLHDAQRSLNRVTFSATVHCLTGCSIGEVLGMTIGSAMGLSDSWTIILSVILAFLFGYALTMMPLLKGGIALGSAMKLAFASDTLSIAAMEIVDNGVMYVIPGAMEAGPTEPLFWGSLATSLILAGIAAFPVTRWLISRGGGMPWCRSAMAPIQLSRRPRKGGRQVRIPMPRITKDTEATSRKSCNRDRPRRTFPVAIPLTIIPD